MTDEIITYKELSSDPVNGVYAIIEGSGYVVVEGNKLIHSPRGVSINDDERLVRV